MNKPRRRKKKDNTKQITIVALFIIIVVLLIIALTSKSKAPNESAPAESSATTSYTQSTASENSDSESSQTVSDTASEPEISEPEESKSFDYSIDITPYEDYIDPVNADQFLILVNSESTITSDYVPADLVTTVNAKAGYESTQLNATADKALTALLKEAAENGYTRIRMSSGYRSYALQSWWFNHYKDQYRSKYPDESSLEEYVLTFSAKPGTSEHQTGLALDMYDTDDNSTFAGTPSANWLAENAHKFGFILRYPEGKESITGIMYESWHFRFVGRTVATEIYENGWTLEEYLEAHN